MKKLILLASIAWLSFGQVSTFPNNTDTTAAGTKNRYAVDLYRAGLLAEYRFDSSTITDYSGNGRVGTVVGSPTISGGGISNLTTANYVTVPNITAGTISFLADFSTVPGMIVGQWAAIYGSASSSSLHLFMRDGSSGANQNSRPSAFQITQANDSLFGIHVVTFVLDASSDTIYIDGIPAISYQTKGASASKGQVSMQIGAATGFGLNFPGTVYYYAAWASELTPAQVYQSAQGMIAIKQATGITIPPRLSVSTANILHCYGDSLTFGQDTAGGGVSAGGYPALLSLTDSFTILNEGFSGQGSVAGQISVPGLVYPQFAPMAQRNSVVLWIGTNDISLGGASPAIVAAYITATARGLIKQGFQLFVLPMISRTGSINGQTNDVWAAQLNVKLSANAASVGYTYVTLSTNLTAAGSYSNTTYFLSDGTHLTDAGGYTLVASAVSAAINAAH